MSDDLVLEHLCLIRSDLSDVKRALDDHSLRLSRIETSIAAMIALPGHSSLYRGVRCQQRGQRARWLRGRRRWRGAARAGSASAAGRAVPRGRTACALLPNCKATFRWVTVSRLSAPSIGGELRTTAFHLGPPPPG